MLHISINYLALKDITVELRAQHGTKTERQTDR